MNLSPLDLRAHVDDPAWMAAYVREVGRLGGVWPCVACGLPVRDGVVCPHCGETDPDGSARERVGVSR